MLAKMAGFDHHLAKPFETGELLALLAQVPADHVE
jgi:CheY-like chemotaxis protein